MQLVSPDAQGSLAAGMVCASAAQTVLVSEQVALGVQVAPVQVTAAWLTFMLRPPFGQLVGALLPQTESVCAQPGLSVVLQLEAPLVS